MEGTSPPAAKCQASKLYQYHPVSLLLLAHQIDLGEWRMEAALTLRPYAASEDDTMILYHTASHG